MFIEMQSLQEFVFTVSTRRIIASGLVNLLAQGIIRFRGAYRGEMLLVKQGIVHSANYSPETRKRRTPLGKSAPH
jgi:hypothetical protein